MSLLGFYDAMPVDWVEPGSTATVSVDGFPIAIANVDGSFYAFQNLCPHQGTTLGGRDLQGCEITCPQHSSRYDVTTGRCVAPSTLDGFNQDLMTFETRVVDGVVQVNV
jgi:3-phenylpropionate/trans-cinnamate dioxygenase ferredoxin component